MSWSKMLTLGVGIVAVGVAALYKYQDRILYQNNLYPQYQVPSSNPEGFRNPQEVGMAYTEHYYRTSDHVKLHAWFVPSKDLAMGTESSQTHPTILFFHANAANMGFRIPNLLKLHQHINANIFMVSYRGYGESEGIPSEDGIMADAEATFTYIQTLPEIDSNKIFLFGRSLGGAVAIYLASQHDSEIRGTILENTFTSISDIVDAVFPLLKYLKSYILTLKWESIKRIKSIHHPILFLSGQKDEIVPKEHMQALFDASVSEGKHMEKFPDGQHNDTWKEGGIKYLDEIDMFMKKVMDSEE